MTAIGAIKQIPTVGGAQHADNLRLRQSADELEATFLAEMLKSAKLGWPRKTLGGGIGEEQVASLLRLELSRDLVKAGGIGLSEHIFRALKERSDADAR